MANTTVAKILAIAPELSGLNYVADDDDNIWNIILADVAGKISSSIYGSLQEEAQRYLSAHLLTLAKQGGARNPFSSGPVSSVSVGEESIAYASKGKALDQYDTTIYGQEFKRIRRSVVIPFKTYIPGAI